MTKITRVPLIILIVVHLVSLFIPSRVLISAWEWMAVSVWEIGRVTVCVGVWVSDSKGSSAIYCLGSSPEHEVQRRDRGPVHTRGRSSETRMHHRRQHRRSWEAHWGGERRMHCTRWQGRSQHTCKNNDSVSCFRSRFDRCRWVFFSLFLIIGLTLYYARKIVFMVLSFLV